MKFMKIIAVAMALASVVACGSNKTDGAAANGADSTKVANAAKTVNPESLKPGKAEVDSVSYLLGVNWGMMIKGYNFGDLNFSQVQKGINDFLKAKGNMNDPEFGKQFKISPETMNEAITEYLGKRQAYVAAVNKEAEAKYFAANRSKSGVTETESGLQYTIIEAGNDNKPSAKDTVFVHYTLTDKDGEVIEEVKAEQNSVMLLLNRVIPGWTEGLQLIGEGGKAKLYVPSKLGYGDRGSGSIEPYSPLVFDIQLDSVKHYVEPVSEK